MKGYKVFKSDWTCQGFKFEVGKTYTHKGKIVMCESGFHFCPKVNFCFGYYSFNPENKIAEVEAVGKVIAGDDKHVTDKIKIIREISWEEMLRLANTGHSNSGNWNSGNSNSGNWNSGNSNSGNRNSGHWNSGHWNSGNWNSGHSNSGHWNSGNSNSGHWNSGHRNSGHRNSGHWNSGNRNSGHWNSGNRNSGHRNSGHWNSGDSNSGHLNTEKPPIRIFNKEFSGDISEIRWPQFFYFDITKWINDELATIQYKDAWKESFDKAPIWDKRKVFDIPNWNAELFFEISGIDLRGKTKEDLV